MKRILTIFALLFLTTGMIFAQTGVFISEYIEGSSSNKALEIYNGTGSEIDFTNYRMLRANNGNATTDTLNFVGTLAADDVFVIANSSADQAILDVSDTTSSMTFYNGDDYLGLEYWNGTDWVIIDVLGVLGVDPGSGWDVAGITTATSNHTLVRKSSVTTGQTDWAVSAGTSTGDSEWEVYDQDTFIYLGQHPGTTPPAIPNLFISEYIEGSSNNKALEIYNASDATVDLTQFIIRNSHNGDGWSSVHAFPAGATLASHDVWVMVADQVSSTYFDTTNANEVIPYSSDSPVHFNGDDARALAFVNGTDTTNVDVIGDETTDPGTAWTVGDTTDATKDHTLVRKSSVTQGQTDWATSAGTDDASSEWVVYPKNTFEYLGQHPGTGTVAIPNLFISEYIEGSSNNKALEIYNASDATVDLTQFIIRNSHNGDGWSSVHAFPAGATLASHDVWVMVADQVSSTYFDTTNANEVIPYSSDSPVHFNGDDARALAFVNGTDTTNVDVIGDETTDPGTAWTVGDTTDATKDHTLVRKSSVTQGQTDWATSAGTDDASSEWVVYPKNTFDYLGQHPGTGGSGFPNLFFSEYIEGSSNNKALEIYNAESVSVDLSQFVILQSSNGGGWQYVHDFPAGAGIVSHDVWVIITDQVDQTLFSDADADEVLGFPSVVHFNGDDARALAYVNGTDTTIVDIIGVPDVDPGSGWDVAGITTATKDHTLVRKESVTTGQTDWTVSAGTTADDSEWEVYDQNTFEYLGQHPGTGGGGGGLPVVETVSRDILVPDAGQAVTVSAFAYADNGLASVNLVYSNDGLTFNNAEMTLVSDSTYSATIPASFIADTTFVGYLVIATDLSAQADTNGAYGFFADITPIDWVKSFNSNSDDGFNFVSMAAKVKGVCTAGSNNFSTGRIEAYLQDTTAAIKIFSFASDTPEMVEGNDYTVTGTTDSFHGQLELVPQTLPDDIIDNGVSTVPDAVELTIQTLLDDAEKYESMLVTVNDAMLNDATPWAFSGGSGATFYINDGSTTDSLALRIDADTDVMDATEPTWPENITGLVTQFDAYQLLPRRLTDFDPSTGVGDENNTLPKTYTLDQNYPNPFNPTTTIKFSLPQNGFVTLKIYDMLGREVATLVNREMQASYQTVEFDASHLASGVYVYRLKVNNFISAKKLMLMK